MPRVPSDHRIASASPNADIEIVARPLARAAYESFGDVVSADDAGDGGRLVNFGTARRWDARAEAVNMRGDRARANVCVFRCSPRAGSPVEVVGLEKHPLSTQLFVPMNARRYLVIVAEGGDAPDLATLAAFVADGTQAVSYKPGIWHHPMIALDTEIDFVCLVWEDDSRDDCVAVAYVPGDRPRVVIA